MRLDPRALRLAASTALAVIAGIAAFTGVAGALGGGWVGYLFTATVFVVVLAAAYYLQGRRTPVRVEGGESYAQPSEPLQDDTTTLGSREPELVSDPGPYEIDGGGILWVELDVAKGDRVRGHLGETTEQDFDWYIVGEENLVLARQRESFDYEQGNEGVTAGRVRWTPRRDGPWYLLIDLYRRSNPREVEVQLRRGQ